MPSVTPPTGAEFKQSFLDSVRLSLGLKGDIRGLSLWSVLGGGIGAVGSRIVQAAVAAHDAVLLERAAKSDLDAYCSARGPVRRKVAAPATGSLTLARPTYAAGGGTIPAGTSLSVGYQGAGYQYVTTADAQLTSTSLQVLVAVQAVAAGTAFHHFHKKTKENKMHEKMLK